MHRGLVVAAGFLVLVLTTGLAADGATNNSLRFVRSDGTRIVFGPLIRVRCGRWAPDNRTPTLHVVVGGPARAAPPRSFWLLQAVVADVQRRRVVRLPREVVSDRPSGALLFVYDRRGDNELSSAEEVSRGRIVFRLARCRPRPAVRFTVNGRLGSELSGKRPVTVRGTFAAGTP
jgi:hypothetical protein